MKTKKMKLQVKIGELVRVKGKTKLMEKMVKTEKPPKKCSKFFFKNPKKDI